MIINNLMNFFIDYWYIVFGVGALVAVAIYTVLKFVKEPNQVEKVKEWLVWVCIEAEKELKSGTGTAKLRMVYSAFLSIPCFKWISRVLSFDEFKVLVDEALKKSKELIISNETLAKYVYGVKEYKAEITKLIEQLSKSKSGE